ncbi:LECM-like protein [Mya arenaria]|uniref:LECM-like protein n=1 Tax=Mya arenaria TaxID=6604 RepID=A0ABY7FJU2_MYAAR|nr:LECM-like protein [Mya arenaria]
MPHQRCRCYFSLQDSVATTVMMNDKEVNVRTITVEDRTGKVKVSLWRNIAAEPVVLGDVVAITNIVVNSKRYNNEESLSSTQFTKIEEFSCPQDWIRIDSSCYYLATALMTWADAELHCEELGGTLAAITTQEESSSINAWLANKGVTWLELRCPQDWIRIDSSCYYLATALMTWADAELHCEELGGTLAAITTQEESSSIFAWLANEGVVTGFVWIGGNDVAVEGTWEWSTGEEFAFEEMRKISEPNGSTNENCLIIYMNSGRPLTYSEDIDANRAFVLEQHDLQLPVSIGAICNLAIGLI